jgi:hypothetical protein
MQRRRFRARQIRRPQDARTGLDLSMLRGPMTAGTSLQSRPSAAGPRLPGTC